MAAPFTAVLLALALGAPQDEKLSPKTAAKVPNGEALPDGAIARLGSGRFRFDGPTDRPVAFSPDGKLLAIASRGVFLFDTTTGKLVHHLPPPDGHFVDVVRFLADGKRVAVGSSHYPRPARLTFYTLADGRPAASPDFAGQRATQIIDFTPDGSRALLMEWGKQAYLWDFKAGLELWAVDHARYHQVLPLTPDGKWFAVTGGRGAELRDADTGKVAATFPDPGQRFQFGRGSGPSAGISLSPDGRISAWAGPVDPAVAVVTARGPAAGVRILPAALDVADRRLFSPDSRYLVGVGHLGTQVWDLAAGYEKGPVARLPAATTGGFSPDGKTLALAGEGFVALFSVGDWKALPPSADPPASVHRVRVTDDGRWVFGYTQQGWVRWPAGGGPADRPFADDPTGIRMRAEMALPAVSADGRVSTELVRLGLGKDREAALAVAEAGGGKPRLLSGGAYHTPYLSPDGRLVASPAPVSMQVWDVKTGEVLFRRKYAAREWVVAALPTSDGRGLARSVVVKHKDASSPVGPEIAPQYTAATVTDHATGRTAKLDPLPWMLYGARFGRDGTRVLSRGRFDATLLKDTVAVWDARTGRRLAAWTGDHDDRDAMDLSADNRSFLAGDHLGRLILVEAATGGERARFQHRGAVSSAAFFPDGTRAVSSSPDGPVYVWSLIGDAGKWDAGQADAVWNDLASSDAKVAFGAIRKLRANPAEAVAFLRERVKPPVVPGDERVAQCLKDLDAPRFAVREQAERELAAVADLIRPKLEGARTKASEEARRRLDQVLKAADGWTPDRLRQVRACEVLEGIGSADAVKLLNEFSGGPPGARLTVEATESLGRHSK